MAFSKDPAGNDWIFTACEGQGASIWWPNKDQWRDEVERMEISVAIPNGLIDVSNGKFVGKTDLGDGYTRWDWLVALPDQQLQRVGEHRQLRALRATARATCRSTSTCCPAASRGAKRQFAQAKPMIEAFEHYFGEYPFKKDGYKLIEVPYSGMEHQSAVTYGNRFANGYLERDWTGVGVSLEVRLHHHPRERPRVVRQRRLGRRRVGHVDSRRLDDVPREPVRRAPVRLRRRAEVRERLQDEGPQPRADRHPARHPPHAAAGHVFQGRALPEHAAQRRRRRRALVEAAARLLPALQVPEHHDGGRRRSSSTRSSGRT